jgi:hypothetical protein
MQLNDGLWLYRPLLRLLPRASPARDDLRLECHR